MMAVVLAGSAEADPVRLTFIGTVNESGATLNGVSAPLGSRFTLNLSVDDSAAGSGRYSVESVSYTLNLGTYVTAGEWAPAALLAATTSYGMTLRSDPRFADRGEHLFMDLATFSDAPKPNNPLSWSNTTLFGDFLVRGLGGYNSPNQLSGLGEYEGVLALSVERDVAPVPEPMSLLMVSIGVIALTGRHRRRVKNNKIG